MTIRAISNPQQVLVQAFEGRELASDPARARWAEIQNHKHFLDSSYQLRASVRDAEVELDLRN